MANKNVDLTEHLDMLIATLVGSDGDIPLATERLQKKLGLDLGERINEYDIKEQIASLDNELRDSIAHKLRTLLILRIYNLVHLVSEKLVDNIDKLRPAELARTHSSLVNSFASLTVSATKVSFDFDHEISKLAEELQISPDEIRSEIKNIKKVTETGFGSARQ